MSRITELNIKNLIFFFSIFSFSFFQFSLFLDLKKIVIIAHNTYNLVYTATGYPAGYLANETGYQLPKKGRISGPTLVINCSLLGSSVPELHQLPVPGEPEVPVVD